MSIPFSTSIIYLHLKQLNAKYKKLHPQDRLKEIYKDFPKAKILLTSSFGINSAILLNMVHKANSKQEIHFVDTRFHFEETLAYKQKLGPFVPRI